MGRRSEISWTRRDENGERREVRADRVGSEWRFAERARRYDQWQTLEDAPLEHWLALLDAVERRSQRRLLEPRIAEGIRRSIRDRFAREV